MKSYKIEIEPTKEQVECIEKNINCGVFIYNKFIQFNIDRTRNRQYYYNNYKFSKYKNTIIKEKSELNVILTCSSRNIRHYIDNANKEFKKLYFNKGVYPNFLDLNRDNCYYYFVRSDRNFVIHFDRRFISVPKIGNIKFKEYGYINKSAIIISGRIVRYGYKYYIIIITNENKIITFYEYNEGIGIDVGLSRYATLSDSTIYSSISLDRLYNKKKYLKKKISNKINLDKYEMSNTAIKELRRIEMINHRIYLTTNDYLNKMVNDIINKKPIFIVIEDLNLTALEKNRYLKRKFKEQYFRLFFNKLKYKCLINSIELRVADRFYPSSKLCSSCKTINNKLKLDDRIFKCNCGNIIDRDLNAAINLRECKKYTII